MKQGGLYDGRELILGPISPFKNIPIRNVGSVRIYQNSNVDIMRIARK